jgi:uncharacterized protein with PIN domain
LSRNIVQKEATSSKKSENDDIRRQRMQSFFDRAKREKRVILTTSRTLRERSNCPQNFFVNPSRMEDSLVNVFREFNLELRREKFLTVCGKCGGDIETTLPSDPRLVGKIFPTETAIYCCKECCQVLHFLPDTTVFTN